MPAYQPHPVIDQILACATFVHRSLGPGLLESTYERCLAFEMTLRGVAFRNQVALPVRFRQQLVHCGYRADFIVEDQVLVELKAVEQLLPLHTAQVLTYLKITGLPRALLINFNVALLKQGVRSFLNDRKASEDRLSTERDMHRPLV